jgi:acyl phosphate:glycerol-3-phosphate acyltransferase
MGMVIFIAGIFFVIAYLLGSISSAVVVCKVCGKKDPRTEGSKNPGASNVLRLHGKLLALITFLGDGLKGFIPVVIAMLFGVHAWLLGFVAVFAVLGHMFPVFFKFQGGKGVATAIGCFIALSPPMALAVIIIWVALVLLLRFASLASIVACVLAPFIVLLFQPLYFAGLVVIAFLVIWRHKDNIKRLIARNEKKLF